MRTFYKDPDSTRPYSIDWAPWLNDLGETIASAAWIVDDGLGIDPAHTPSVVGGVHTLWVTGGTVGSQYGMTSRVTTANGYVEDSTITIKIRQK